MLSSSCCLSVPVYSHISTLRTTQYHPRISSAQTLMESPGFTSTLEADTHADTCVAGKNCIPLYYTDRTCDVQPYSDTYTPMKDVPIIAAATGYTSATGLQYILVIPEALYMPSLTHSLFNPNQFRHFGTIVQDNPFCPDPMKIETADGSFTACLKSKGLDIFLTTWAPTQADLNSLPHIVLCSSSPWNPQQIELPSVSLVEQEEMEWRNEWRNIQGVTREPSTTTTFDLDEIRRRLLSCTSYSVASLASIIDRRKILAARTQDAPSIPEPGPLSEHEHQPLRTFLSSERHSKTTPEELSERWGLSLAQAKLTLKATTRYLIRSALMPLARRYRADRMFHLNRLGGTFATDTMHMKCASIHGEQYCQIFANKNFFAAAYPITSKSQAHEPLDTFVRDYGAMDLLISDGAAEQVGKHTKFQAILRKYNITHKASERDRSNQNPAEGVIREIRRKWYRLLFKTNCPSRLWNYGIPYVCSLMNHTASYSGRLQGRTPIEALLGETPDISEYLDFGWYDLVWYKEDAGLGDVKLGRFIGVSHSTGSLMSYFILPASGIPISRSTVQRVTENEKTTDANRERITSLNRRLAEKFKEERLVSSDTTFKPIPGDWPDIFDDDPEFLAEFSKPFDNVDVKEAEDEFDPDSFDGYIDMKLNIEQPGRTENSFARVTKRMKDHAGNPIGIANTNPLLDTRIYEVEYEDGHIAAMSANAIAENLLSQVDPDGHRLLTFDSIIGHRTDGTDVKPGDSIITSANGTTRRRHTTIGWDIQILWKDGQTTWNKLKDVKDSYPCQLADYAIENHLDELPAFQWWIPYVLKKRDRIIAKTKTNYWQTTHKYGLEIPRNFQDCVRIDLENNNTLWQDATKAEMKVARPAFELHDGAVTDLIGYQKIRCHLVYDVKLGENFRRKARYCANGSTTDTPNSLTYSSVVSRDSVRIALTVAALNDLDILVCDIEGAYLTAKCREKIYTIAGPEFGSEQGSIMIIKMALYGLKSSGAAFRSKLAGVLNDMNFRPSLADPDVWLRAATKPDGFTYYEIVLVYVDDVMVISHIPLSTIEGIQKTFKLKGGKADTPDMYLGVSLEKKTNPQGTVCWSMSPEKYVAASVLNVEEKLAKEGRALPTNCKTPMLTTYHPSDDTSPELTTDGVRYYQELIGILRWAIEIGRLDILLEVSLLSSHLALPRQGHLEQVYHIFGYLKKASRRRLFMDPDHPVISEDRFVSYDWTEFYRYASEPLPPNMPEPRGRMMTMHCFVDSDHAGDKMTRRSQTGILIFCNRAPIISYSKRQNSVECSTYGSELVAMRQAIDLVRGLRYKLRMFGIPIEGPSDVFCDNESVFKNVSRPESTLSKKQHSISYHSCREAVASKVVRIAKENTMTNLADIFTKTMNMPKRESLLNKFMY